MTIELIHGDCLELSKPITAKLILTDPPYGTTNCKWDVPFDLPAFWNLVNNSSNGFCISFAQTPFDKVLGASNIENLKYELIWEKTSATGFLNAKKMPLKAHENILIFYKSLPTYNPQKTTGHKPVNSYTKNGDDGDCYGKTLSGISGGGSTERYPRSVLKYSSDKQKTNLHPTQKPLELIEYLIKTYTNEGDTVFDPFMGSGTVGLACKRLNRNFIGIEKDLNYFNIAKERIENN